MFRYFSTPEYSWCLISRLHCNHPNIPLHYYPRIEAYRKEKYKDLCKKLYVRQKCPRIWNDTTKLAQTKSIMNLFTSLQALHVKLTSNEEETKLYKRI